jgi:hypothetical protein
MDKEQAIAFLQGMWAAAGRDVPNDEQAIKGWAELPYGVQSYFDENRVVVATCGSAPIWERDPLPSPIVEYLAEYDRAQAVEQSTPLDRCVECLAESSAHCDRLTKDLHSIAAQLGIPTDDQMMGAIGQRLSELLATEELCQAGLPVPYGDRS